MLLSSLLLTPILGVLAIFFNKDRGASSANIKSIALITSILNFFISLVIFILFDFSTNQFQFVQEYHEISYFDFYLGVDGLSIYFILLTTLIIPISLVSNWKSITKDVESYVIIILLLESLLLAVFLVLDILLFYIFFESILPPLFILIGLFGSDNRVKASFYLFLYTLLGSLFLLLSILAMSSIMSTTDLDTLFKGNFVYLTQLFLFYGIFIAFAVKTPTIFLNTWLLKAHVESPLGGSIILAAIVLKLSLYGILRLILPILPKAYMEYTYIIFLIGVITIVYASLSTLRTIVVKYRTQIRYVNIVRGFKLIIFYFLFMSTVLLFCWDGYYLFIVILLNLATGISLVIITHRFNKIIYYPGTALGMFLGNYLFLIDKVIANSQYNDTLSVICFSIIFTMCLIGIFNNDKAMSFKDKWLFIWEYKYLFLSIALGLWSIIFIINIILLLLGIGIIVNITTPALFIYTFLTKFTLLKFIFTCAICSVTKEVKLDNLSLSLSGLVFIILSGGFTYYYLTPNINIITSLGLIKLGVMFKYSCGLMDGSANYKDGQGLAEGVCNILTNFSIFRRLSPLFSTNFINNMDRSSPFRSPYDNIIQNKINTYSLNKISRFTRVDIPKMISDHLDVSCSYKGISNDLNILLRNNLLDIKDVISNFTSNYSNLTCIINLTCYDQNIRINTIFKNGNLESFDLQRTNLDLAKSSKYKNSFYEGSRDKIKELLRLTEPCNVGKNLQVFTEQGFSSFYNTFQQYNSIEETFNYDFQQDIDNPIEKPYSQDKEKQSLLKDAKPEYIQSRDGENWPLKYYSSKFPCISAEMELLTAEEKENKILLLFDKGKLLTSIVGYLEEILYTGRTVLLDYYITIFSKSQAREIVDNFEFDRISTDPYFEGVLKALHIAFIERFSESIESNNIDITKIKPFSKLYLDNSLFYDDSFEQDSSSNVIDYTSSNTGDFSSSNVIDYTSSNRGDSSSSNVIGHTSSNRGDSSSSNVIGHTSSNIGGQSSSTVRDQTELEQTYLKEFGHAKIKESINRLRSRQKEYYVSMRSKGKNSIACVLRDIGFIFKDGILKESGMENEITHTLTKLSIVIPNLFYGGSNNPVYNPSSIGVSTLCYRLQGLIADNLTKDLTDYETHILINELISRLENLYQDRISEGVTYMRCNFSQIGFILSGGTVLCEKGDELTNEFTCLLDKLIATRPDWFAKSGTHIQFQGTSVRSICSKLIDSVWKPLTKHEICDLLRRLETRREKFMADNYGSSKKVGCRLSDFNISISGLVMEGIETNSFTSLLDKLFRQNPHFFKNLASTNVITLISNLKRMLGY